MIFDFSLPLGVGLALLWVAVFPLLLLAFSWRGILAGRHGSRFAVCASGVFLGWGFMQAGLSVSWVEAGIGFCVLASALILFLQIWGLLTRGYTLGILLTLLDGRGPLTADQVATGYRGGEGLDWIMRHRLAGLASAGLVDLDGDAIRLSPRLGVGIAIAYRACVVLFGLRRTG